MKRLNKESISGIPTLYKLISMNLMGLESSLTITPNKPIYLPKIIAKSLNSENTGISAEDIYTLVPVSDYIEDNAEVSCEISVVSEISKTGFASLDIYGDFLHILKKVKDGREEEEVREIVQPKITADSRTSDLIRFYEETTDTFLSLSSFYRYLKILELFENSKSIPEAIEDSEDIETILSVVYPSIIATTYYLLDFILNPDDYTLNVEASEDVEERVQKIFTEMRERLLFFGRSIDEILSKLV